MVMAKIYTREQSLCPAQTERKPRPPQYTSHVERIGSKELELIPGERKNGIKANEDNL